MESARAEAAQCDAGAIRAHDGAAAPDVAAPGGRASAPGEEAAPPESSGPGGGGTDKGEAQTPAPSSDGAGDAGPQGGGGGRGVRVSGRVRTPARHEFPLTEEPRQTPPPRAKRGEEGTDARKSPAKKRPAAPQRSAGSPAKRAATDAAPGTSPKQGSVRALTLTSSPAKGLANPQTQTQPNQHTQQAVNHALRSASPLREIRPRIVARDAVPGDAAPGLRIKLPRQPAVAPASPLRSGAGSPARRYAAPEARQSPRRGAKAAPRPGHRKKDNTKAPALRLTARPAAKNLEVCAACGGGGSLICCDACPASLHLECLDPPMAEADVPAEAWFCDACRAPPAPLKRVAGVGGVWSALAASAQSRNPAAFSVPKRIRRTAAKAAAEPHHMQHAHHGAASTGAPAAGDAAPRTCDAGWCHWCGRGARDGAVLGPLLRCDGCALLWHGECLPEPLFRPPPPGRPWRCPAHVDAASLEAAGVPREAILRALRAPHVRPCGAADNATQPCDPIADLAQLERAAQVVEEPVVRLHLRWLADEAAAAQPGLRLASAGGCAVPPDVVAAYRSARSVGL